MTLKSLFLAPARFCSGRARLARRPDQHGPQPPPNDELYGGYSLLFRPYDHTQANPFSGVHEWLGRLTARALPIVGCWLGIKGDVSGDYRNDGPNFNPHSYFFLAGPQLSLAFRRIHALCAWMVGSAHLNQQVIPSLKSDSTFAMASGGGLDLGTLAPPGLAHHR